MEYYKLGLLFAAVCVFAGILEFLYNILSDTTTLTNLWNVHLLAIISFYLGSLIIGVFAMVRIFRKPMMSVFVCGECDKAFQEEIGLRKHYSEHLIKQ